jgi:hypothetical protein
MEQGRNDRIKDDEGISECGENVYFFRKGDGILFSYALSRFLREHKNLEVVSMTTYFDSDAYLRKLNGTCVVFREKNK